MKLTKKYLKFYEEEVRKWVEIFGLTEWELFFKFADFSKDNRFAEVKHFYQSKQAYFYLTKEIDFSSERIEKEIKDAALHEVLHLLLARLSVLAADRSWSEVDWNSAEHEVINRISKLLREE
jgi:hypothetical protein